jgi:hypothetical protein
VEHQIQYGVLHDDLTPRPAYLAVAAVGRLLAGAKPIGRWRTDDSHAHGYLFRARPDGQEKAVLVAWRDDGDADVKLNVPTERVVDHLGRERAGSWIGELHLSASPVFAVIPLDVASNLKLDPPPKPATQPTTKPPASAIPAVLQVQLPPTTVALKRSAYVLPPAQAHRVPVIAYNFGERETTVRLSVTTPRDLACNLVDSVTLPPNGRQEITLELGPREPTLKARTITIRGSVAGADVPAVVSFRIVDEPPATQATQPSQ